jgi:hypothetical protein
MLLFTCYLHEFTFTGKKYFSEYSLELAFYQILPTFAPQKYDNFFEQIWLLCSRVLSINLKDFHLRIYGFIELKCSRKNSLNLSNP